MLQDLFVYTQFKMVYKSTSGVVFSCIN